MIRFEDGQRVRIIDSEHPLAGMVGIVVRIRIADNGAWVRMDTELPKELRAFDNPKDKRYKHLKLYPEQCEPYNVK